MDSGGAYQAERPESGEATRVGAEGGRGKERGEIVTAPRKAKPKPYSPPESEVLESTIAILRFLGFDVHRRNVGARKIGAHYVRFNEPGMSDIWGTMPDGRRFELEIKRFGKRPTVKQLDWLRSQNNEHCAAFWADSSREVELVARALMQGAWIEYHETGDAYDLVMRIRV